jgi:hypothetical protein
MIDNKKDYISNISSDNKYYDLYLLLKRRGNNDLSKKYYSMVSKNKIDSINNKESIFNNIHNPNEEEIENVLLGIWTKEEYISKNYQDILFKDIANLYWERGNKKQVTIISIIK